MQITGKLKAKMNVEVVSSSFTKREFVLTVDTEKYPQHIKFQLSNLNCSMITQYAIGSELIVYFNVFGREWVNPKGEAIYFNTLEVWKIELVRNLQVDTGKTTTMPNFDLPSFDGPDEDDNEYNDLPF